MRRGQLLHSVSHTGDMALNTGVPYGFERWDGAAWRRFDPFDGEPHGWAAVGLVIPARTDWPVRVSVPEHTEPGRHRIIKWVDAAHRGVRQVALTAEFTVRDAAPEDYKRVGIWTERLDSGARLRVERPHPGTFHRLEGFSLTR